ncbi:hypothetical protein [Scytonema sp. PCC 10023]|uniref:hypothetical protein n=1 Tax=Scytonema sp. PCC 10023 TaxID=1680591 RepID=UPI0039C5D362
MPITKQGHIAYLGFKSSDCALSAIAALKTLLKRQAVTLAGVPRSWRKAREAAKTAN